MKAKAMNAGNTLIVLVCLMQGFVSTARAEYIQWEVKTFPTATTDAGDILYTPGDYVFAWNAQNGGVDITCGGVTFYGSATQSVPSGVTISIPTISYTPPSQNAGLFGGSGAFYDLMKVIAYSASDYTLTINGLTAENLYLVQFLAHQGNTTAARTWALLYDGGDSTNSTGWIDSNSGSDPDSATLLFNATSTSNNIVVDTVWGYSIYNAVSIRDMGPVSSVNWSNTVYTAGADSENIILKTGQYEFAWNCAGASDLVVNGVPFYADNSVNPTSSEVTISVGAGTTNITGQNAAAPYSGSFATLMSTLIANSANSVNYTLHVDNLTPGRRYRVQFISHQKVDYAGVRDMEFHHGSAAHTTLRSGAFDAFTPSTSIVHFTAATGRQSFYVRADLTDRSIINAVSVFDVTPRGTMIKVL